MAWTNSKMFRPMVADVFDNTTAFDFGADSFKMALYDDSITPNNDVTATLSAYTGASSIWVATATPQIFESGQWAQGGVALTGQTLNSGTADLVFFDATDPESGTAADLAAVVGTYTYDDTLTTPVADQGACYNYLGGPNSVVNGTFRVQIHASGLWSITL